MSTCPSSAAFRWVGTPTVGVNENKSREKRPLHGLNSFQPTWRGAATTPRHRPTSPGGNDMYRYFAPPSHRDGRLGVHHIAHGGVEGKALSCAWAVAGARSKRARWSYKGGLLPRCWVSPFPVNTPTFSNGAIRCLRHRYDIRSPNPRPGYLTNRTLHRSPTASSIVYPTYTRALDEGKISTK